MMGSCDKDSLYVKLIVAYVTGPSFHLYETKQSSHKKNFHTFSTSNKNEKR